MSSRRTSGIELQFWKLRHQFERVKGRSDFEFREVQIWLANRANWIVSPSQARDESHPKPNRRWNDAD